MTNKILKLEPLFTDSDLLDVERIISVLGNYIRIKRDTNDIFLTQKGNKVNVCKKILLFAIALKLLKNENIIDGESFSAQAVSKKLQIKKGSIDSAFSRLKKEGFILGSGSDYTVPNYKIDEILGLFKEEGSNE